MKKLVLSASAAALAFFSLSAAASAQTAAGPSLNGSIGYTHMTLDQVFDEDFDDADIDFGAIHGRLGARFHPNFGLEGELNVGVNDFEITEGANRVSLGLNYSATAFAMAVLPVDPNFELHARLGFGFADVSAEASGPDLGDFDESEGDTLWAAGVGGQYFFDGVNGIRADYTRYMAGDDSEVEIDALSASYVRRF